MLKRMSFQTHFCKDFQKKCVCSQILMKEYKTVQQKNKITFLLSILVLDWEGGGDIFDILFHIMKQFK